MTQPQDPRKNPLQDDEIALARVLRALPSAEPPAHLDNAILRSATDALSPARPKPVRGIRWLPTWAIGTAAAAVLAVGVGVQLRPPLAPQYPAAGVQEKAPELPQARERLNIELIEPEPRAAPPPASSPPEPQPRSGRPPPPPAPAAAPAPPPLPVALPERQAAALPEEAAESDAAADLGQAQGSTLDTIEVTGSRIRSEATDQARRAHQESYARRAQAKAAQAQDSQDQARAAAEPADTFTPAAGAVVRREVAAPAAAAAPPTAFADAESENGVAAMPPVADDAQLLPAQWFDRIRERRRQGDTAGARASLALFVRTYPEAPIPSDLARLR